MTDVIQFCGDSREWIVGAAAGGFAPGVVTFPVHVVVTVERRVWLRRRVTVRFSSICPPQSTLFVRRVLSLLSVGRAVCVTKRSDWKGFDKG